MKKIVSLLLLLSVYFVAFAQDGEQAQMADVLRSNGKIYVVVAVVVVILLGLFIYLWRLDRKISRIEKDHRNVK
jgi:CcmD family protein